MAEVMRAVKAEVDQELHSAIALEKIRRGQKGTIEGLVREALIYYFMELTDIERDAARKSKSIET